MKVPEDQLFVEGNVLQVTFPLGLLCSYEWFLSGLRGEGHSASSGRSQAPSASLCPPQGTVRKVLELCDEQLYQVQEPGLP